MNARPGIIAIDHDDYHAEYVGHLRDGRQFFLTTPFEPAIAGSKGCEFVALFIFDAHGNLLDAQVDNFGPRESLDKDARRRCRDQRLASLGDATFDRIEIKPFAVERFGSVFGLIVREPEDEEDVGAVEMQPGNYMAFFEPWDSGEYDT